MLLTREVVVALRRAVDLEWAIRGRNIPAFSRSIPGLRYQDEGWERGMTTEEREATVEAAVAVSEINLRGLVPAVVPLFDAASVYAMPTGTYLKWIKPLFDRAVGILALILCLPLLALIAAAVVIAMGLPVFLKQDRVGRYGYVFRVWKFRTMAPDRRLINLEWLGDDRRQTHKSADDPRITPLGRWLRATRLDEIPQFINVVLGDLSLVGPRPELVNIVAEYEQWQHRRHAIKPGVTGLWQISDKGDTLLRDCTEMELRYLDNVSFRTDLDILMRTLPAMVRRGGI